MMAMIGWGQPPMQFIVDMAARYYGESITHACAIVGRTVDRVDADFSYVLADRDHQIGSLTIAAGDDGLRAAYLHGGRRRPVVPNCSATRCWRPAGRPQRKWMRCRLSYYSPTTTQEGAPTS